MQTNFDNPEYEPSVLANWLQAVKQFSFLSSLNARIGMAIYGILLPIVCHALTINQTPRSASWQSGDWRDKFSFVLSGECGWPVFPFLIFAMICLGMVIYGEAKAFSKAWVRLGIFSGVFVFGWYLFAFSSVVFFTPFASLGLLLVATIWLIFVHGWLEFLELLIAKDSTAIVAVATFLGTIVLCLSGFILILILVLILSMALAFLVYLGMSIRILNLHPPARRFTLLHLMIWVTWFAAFAAALQKAIALSFIKYSQLS